MISKIQFLEENLWETHSAHSQVVQKVIGYKNGIIKYTAMKSNELEQYILTWGSVHGIMLSEKIKPQSNKTSITSFFKSFNYYGI